MVFMNGKMLIKKQASLPYFKNTLYLRRRIFTIPSLINPIADTGLILALLFIINKPKYNKHEKVSFYSFPWRHLLFDFL